MTASTDSSALDLPPGLRARLMVGLEVHVELATRSKMFTSAPNVAHPDNFDAGPNTLCDPVVVGMPGVLPVINQRAVEMSIRVGLALGCRIARFTKWDRKSYYYPDLPKNYQISQYDLPLCFDGALDIPTSEELDAPTKRIRIIRAHLEEDAGKLLHEAPGGVPIDHSIVDLNRAGTPLLEIVTFPDLESPAEVVMFAQTLRHICRHLGVTEGIMQKGHMRFEPNINVILEKDGQVFKTPIVEIKNLNSFKALHDSVAYEYHRQVEDWLQTGKVMDKRAKTTRGWDDVRCETTLQRHKEDADEYRYFPDPDLVPLVIEDRWIEELVAAMPALPRAREQRYVKELGLGLTEARILLDDPRLTTFFEEVLAAGVEPRRATALLLNNGAKRANERNCGVPQLGITPAQIKQIVALADAGKIGSVAVDTLFGLCCDPAPGSQSIDEPRTSASGASGINLPSGSAPGSAGGYSGSGGYAPSQNLEDVARAHGLIQVSDTAALEKFVAEVLADPRNTKALADLQAGKEKALGALLGQVMKLSKGQANPQVVSQIIKQKLQG
ncbi:MAG: Asp-tRNA(Asn)/Glu-tRNA(Gln) amidotransferase subunit GatB [Phycisphaeraceae bacterium]|nr:Asp-tRNA(Asn)/Glu-tRNA(Gln) amidotransferase subunit GatB [Phycisphaeraceae bacterium]